MRARRKSNSIAADRAATPGHSSRRVLLADSDPIFLAGLDASLGKQLLLKGGVTTGAEIFQALDGSDVLISGFVFGCGRTSLDLLPDIRAHRPDVEVIVMISPTMAWIGPRLQAAGAKGVLCRRTSPQDLPRLVLDALQGRPLPALAGNLPAPGSTADSADLSLLSARQFEVFGLIGRGKSSTEIGALLSISDKTVSAHREHIKAKLGFHSSAQLKIVAISHAAWQATGTTFSLLLTIW